MIEKIKRKLIKKEIIEKVLIIFLCIQPILDLYHLFEDNIVNYFGFSPSTIIRIVFIGILGILFLLVFRNKKEIWLYIAYTCLLIIYVILHHLNALNFTDFYGGYDFGYTLVSELFYIIRMLMPLFIIIVSSHYKFSDKRIEKIINILIFTICGSIIVTNLLGISTGSYSKEIIKGNYFCWFKEGRCGLIYLDLASKGLFLDPNRISALLVLLTPMTFYNLINNPKIKNIIIIFVNMLGMQMLGTKVSTFGFIIIAILSLIIYFYFIFIKKDIKFKHKVCITILCAIAYSLITLPYAPAINRNDVRNTMLSNYNNGVYKEKEESEKEQEKLNETLKDSLKKTTTKKANVTTNKKTTKKANITTNKKTTDELLQEMTKEEKDKYLIKYVEKNYKNHHLHYDFVFKSYPYTYDAEFWYNVMKLSIEEKSSFRVLEELMLKRVKEINNNKYDDYLGITFTRMGNIFDLERDFLSHYYTLGIIGLIILLFPYLIIVLVCIIKILISYKKSFTVRNIFLLMGIGISLCSAYFTGNVMDGLIVTLILGFLIGQLINGTFNIGNNIK